MGFRSHLLLRGWCGFEGGGVASSLLSKGCDCVCVCLVSRCGERTHGLRDFT